MKKKLLFLFTLAALLGALCFSAGAIASKRPYTESKKIKIIDHVVYQYRNIPNQPKHYAVIDYFDTDEAANDRKIAKTVKIVEKIGKIPVTEIQVDLPGEADGVNGPKSGGRTSPLTRKLILPQSINNLHTHAFAGFTAVQSITLPDTITEIPEGTFMDCRSLRELNMSDKLTRIGDEAFKGCGCIKNLNLPETLEYIGHFAFQNSLFKKIVLPAATRFGDAVFSQCWALEKVSFRCSEKGRSCTVGEGMFSNCTGLKTVVFSKNLAKIYIDYSAFQNCWNLTTVKNLNKVKVIGNSAFASCNSLTEFTIPAGIEFVHPYAFLGCARIKTVYLNSKNPNLLMDSLAHYSDELFLDSNFIDYLRNDCMIYVKNADMLRMVQEEALHSKAEIAV